MSIHDEPEDNRPRLKRRIEWRSKDRSATIEVYGSWNRFEKPTVLNYERRGLFACEVEVPVGEHYYRFLVDDDWETDDTVSKTVKLGNEYNTLVAEVQDSSAPAKAAEPADSGDGAESIMYDSVSRSFKVGRSTSSKKKSKRSTRNRPSMEISLPAVLKINEDQEESGEDEPDKSGPPPTGLDAGGGSAAAPERKKREKKRRRKKRVKKRAGKGYEFSPDVELEKAFKKKEEEWARMCFVQQLRQQQAHNDEINRVKTLWKQERQVRVEMHKKVMKAKTELETDLRNSKAELNKLKNNIALDQSADAKKLSTLTADNEKLNKQLNELQESRKTLESQVVDMKKSTGATTEAQEKMMADLKKELADSKSQLSKLESDNAALVKKNEVAQATIEEGREQHKKALESERTRVTTMQSSNKEDQEMLSNLRSERNKLEVDLREKTRDVSKLEDELRELKVAQEESASQNDGLLRKIKALESDTSAAEQTEKQLREAKDEHAKETKGLNENISRLEDKLKSMEERVSEQKKEFDASMEKYKTESEANINSLQSSGSEHQKRLTELSGQLEKANADITAQREQIRDTAEKLSEAAAEVERKTKALEEAEKALDETKKEAGDTGDKLTALGKDLSSTQDELKAAQDALAKAKEASQERQDALQKELGALRESSNSNESVITTLRAEMESRVAKITELNDQLGKLSGESDEMREKLSQAEADLKNKTVEAESFEEKVKVMEKSMETQRADSQKEMDDLSNKLSQVRKEAQENEDKSRERIAQVEQEKVDLETSFQQRQKEFDELELKTKKAMADFEIEKNTWAAERDSLAAKVAAANEKDQKILQCCKNLFREFEAVRASMDQVRSLKLDELERMNEFFPNFQELLNKTLDFNAKLVKDTMEKYKRELSLRRKYFNIVQELRGNIRVFCRVRPILPFEHKKGLKTGLQFPVEEDFVIEIKSATAPDGKFVFEYDRVYKPKTSQEAVSEDTTEYVQSVMDGYNVSIFAYGQTGSGKTYTMDGPNENPGVNLRALEELFKIAEERKPMFEYTITMQVFEIYNDKVACLLTDIKERKKNAKNPKLNFKCRLNNDGTVYVENAKEVEVKSKDDVLSTLSIAKKNRKTASTKMNDTSSRSHMILVVNVRGFNVPANIEYLGKLFLVDLAGSERIAKSEVKGERLKEATEINKSLTALGDVMQALQKKQKFIPYRNSTLTYLMQNALGGHAKTVMFINISPTSNHMSETISSLRFAQRVAKVELGKAQKTYKKIDKLNSKVSKGKS